MTGQFRDVEAEIYFRHTIRVAMIDATEEEVNIVARQMVENLKTVKGKMNNVIKQ
jgi:uncharacterized protein (UPF0261 family)